jgi:hypothetical protein
MKILFRLIIVLILLSTSSALFGQEIKLPPRQVLPGTSASQIYTDEAGEVSWQRLQVLPSNLTSYLQNEIARDVSGLLYRATTNTSSGPPGVDWEPLKDDLGSHVATTTLDMDGNPIINVGAPTNPADALTYRTVDNLQDKNIAYWNNSVKQFENTFSIYDPISGFSWMDDFQMNGNILTGLANGVNPGDATRYAQHTFWTRTNQETDWQSTVATKETIEFTETRGLTWVEAFNTTDTVILDDGVYTGQMLRLWVMPALRTEDLVIQQGVGGSYLSYPPGAIITFIYLGSWQPQLIYDPNQGSAAQNLQEVTDLGASTTNNSTFLGGITTSTIYDLDVLKNNPSSTRGINIFPNDGLIEGLNQGLALRNDLSNNVISFTRFGLDDAIVITDTETLIKGVTDPTTAGLNDLNTTLANIYTAGGTDDQTLTLVGSDLTIENGNTVTLPSGDGNGILDGGQNDVIPSNSRFRFPIAPGLGTNGSEMLFGFPSGTNRNSSGFVYVSEDYDPASAAFSFAVDDLGNYVDSQFAFDDGDNTTRYKPGEIYFQGVSAPFGHRYLFTSTGLRFTGTIFGGDYIAIPFAGPSASTYGQVRVTDDSGNTTWEDYFPASLTGQVDAVVAGTNVSVDNTDPQNPIVSVPSLDDADNDPTNELDSKWTEDGGSNIRRETGSVSIGFHLLGRASIGADVTSDWRAELTIANQSAFTLSPANNKTLLLFNPQATGSDQETLGSLFFAPYNIARAHAGIAAFQDGADSDNIGLKFYTHPGNGSSDDAYEAAYFDDVGRLHLNRLTTDAESTTYSGLVGWNGDGQLVGVNTNDFAPDGNGILENEGPHLLDDGTLLRWATEPLGSIGRGELANAISATNISYNYLKNYGNNSKGFLLQMLVDENNGNAIDASLTLSTNDDRTDIDANGLWEFTSTLSYRRGFDWAANEFLLDGTDALTMPSALPPGSNYAWTQNANGSGQWTEITGGGGGDNLGGHVMTQDLITDGNFIRNSVASASKVAIPAAGLQVFNNAETEYVGMTEDVIEFAGSSRTNKRGLRWNGSNDLEWIVGSGGLFGVDTPDSQPGTNGSVWTVDTDGSGSWTVPSGGGTPSYRGFAAELRGTFSIPSGAWTKISLNTEMHDTHNQFDPSGPNYRFTANQAGYYQVNAQIVIEDATNNSKILCAVYKNGSIEKLMGRGTVSATSGEFAGFGGSAVIYMNGTTDYLELYGWSNSTNIRFVSPGVGYTRMDAYFIGN